mmetsp:Transcript_33892/g.95242  ORF Transcript_33892/g.95242 Transcript_33892/m.95242 type:complete len:224 (+) Transcript_33892:614-1285(+)
MRCSMSFLVSLAICLPVLSSQVSTPSTPLRSSCFARSSNASNSFSRLPVKPARTPLTASAISPMRLSICTSSSFVLCSTESDCSLCLLNRRLSSRRSFLNSVSSARSPNFDSRTRATTSFFDSSAIIWSWPCLSLSTRARPPCRCASRMATPPRIFLSRSAMATSCLPSTSASMKACGLGLKGFLFASVASMSLISLYSFSKRGSSSFWALSEYCLLFSTAWT